MNYIKLMEYYRENKIIHLQYRDRNKIKIYIGKIERIDLIYKEIYLTSKKRIAFQRIVGLK